MRGATEVAVIGGGIAGCTAAHGLARRGFKVTLFEQRHLAYGASGRNLGLLLNDFGAESVTMMREALTAYRELADGPVPFELRETSYLLLPTTDEQVEVTREKVAELGRVGLASEPLDAGAVAKILPQLGGAARVRTSCMAVGRSRRLTRLAPLRRPPARRAPPSRSAPGSVSFPPAADGSMGC